MKALRDFSGIYLHREPIDLRKGDQGLSVLVQHAFGDKLFSGAIFAFTNRSRSSLKMLYWNQSGFAIWMTRLEKEKFHWPKHLSGEQIQLSVEQAEWLLKGFDLSKMRPHRSLEYELID